MTHDQLERYINNFTPNQREAVAKQVMDSELLRKAFETVGGKNILNSCVDLITANVMQIVRVCGENSQEEIDMKVFQSAIEINTTYKLMTDWAKILIRGGEHKDKAEKIT